MSDKLTQNEDAMSDFILKVEKAVRAARDGYVCEVIPRLPYKEATHRERKARRDEDVLARGLQSEGHAYPSASEILANPLMALSLTENVRRPAPSFPHSKHCHCAE